MFVCYQAIHSRICVHLTSCLPEWHYHHQLFLPINNFTTTTSTWGMDAACLPILAISTRLQPSDPVTQWPSVWWCLDGACHQSVIVTSPQPGTYITLALYLYFRCLLVYIVYVIAEESYFGFSMEDFGILVNSGFLTNMDSHPRQFRAAYYCRSTKRDKMHNMNKAWIAPLSQRKKLNPLITAKSLVGTCGNGWQEPRMTPKNNKMITMNFGHHTTTTA
jgi:hypothetical protein